MSDLLKLILNSDLAKSLESGEIQKAATAVGEKLVANGTIPSSDLVKFQGAVDYLLPVLLTLAIQYAEKI